MKRRHLRRVVRVTGDLFWIATGLIVLLGLAIIWPFTLGRHS